MLCGFLTWLGVFPFRVSLPLSLCLSTLGPFRFRSYRLGSGLFHLGSSSSPLCFLTVLLVLALGLSFASSLLVPLLSFSPLGVSCPFVRVFPQISHPSLLRVGLFSSRFCRSVVLPQRLPRSHSLSPFAFILSVVIGDFPDVFLFCMFLRFGFPYHFLSGFFPLLLSLCVSSFSCLLSFFLDLFPFLSLRVIPFPFRSCCGSTFYLPATRFNVPIPFFIVIGLVLFLFWSFVRFPSLSAGSESLGGGGGGCPLTLRRFI